MEQGQWQEWTAETGFRRVLSRRQDKLTDAAQQAITFIVIGQGSFPADMLRYDKCWPATEQDSFAIASESQRRTIKLRGLKVPTFARWQSFNWEVTK